MPSSYTASLRFEKQFTGENVNTWGDRLNTALDRVDTAVAGFTSVALTGDYTLTSSNSSADEARSAVLKFTGGAGPFNVTIPSVSKIYTIWNATTGPITITTGSGGTQQIDATDIVQVFCDGTNVKTLGYSGASAKAYIASAVSGGGTALPSVTGSAGKWLTNNGTIPNWAYPTTADLQDIASYRSTERAFALVMSLVF